MNCELLADVLFKSFIINLVLFVIWSGLFIFAHDTIYKLHTKWFDMSVETFDSIHYLLLGIYKVYILCFNLIPYLILR